MRLPLALAEICRLLEAHDAARRYALSALDAMPLPAGDAAPPAAAGDDTGERVGQALFATADALDAAGIGIGNGPEGANLKPNSLPCQRPRMRA